jgi:hypothetical protein
MQPAESRSAAAGPLDRGLWSAPLNVAAVLLIFVKDRRNDFIYT